MPNNIPYNAVAAAANVVFGLMLIVLMVAVPVAIYCVTKVIFDHRETRKRVQYLRRNI